MNSSTNQKINIIIDYSIIILSSISILVSLIMFIFIIYNILKIKNSPNRVGLLLTGNMYLSLLFSGIIFLQQYIYVLPGHIYLLITLNDGIYCQIRLYFVLVSLSLIFYSNSLQSIYRLCRIVYYTRRLFQSFYFYKIIIIIQWIICLLLMIPSFIIGNSKYSYNDYLCRTDYGDYKTTLINGILIYSIPMLITIGCYVYTLKKIRKKNNNIIIRMTHIQKILIRRDIIVLFRICILLGLMMTFFIPSIIITIIYSLTGYEPWWSSQIQWLVFNFSTTSVTIILPWISPHVKNLLTRNFYHYHHHHNIVTPFNIRLN